MAQKNNSSTINENLLLGDGDRIKDQSEHLQLLDHASENPEAPFKKPPLPEGVARPGFLFGLPLPS